MKTLNQLFMAATLVGATTLAMANPPEAPTKPVVEQQHANAHKASAQHKQVVKAKATHKAKAHKAKAHKTAAHA